MRKINIQRDVDSRKRNADAVTQTTTQIETEPIKEIEDAKSEVVQEPEGDKIGEPDKKSKKRKRTTEGDV